MEELQKKLLKDGTCFLILPKRVFGNFDLCLSMLARIQIDNLEKLTGQKIYLILAI